MDGIEREKLPWQCNDCNTDHFCIDQGECLHKQCLDAVDEGELSEGDEWNEDQPDQTVEEDDMQALLLAALKK